MMHGEMVGDNAKFYSAGARLRLFPLDVNDAGGSAPQTENRQRLFLTELGRVPPESHLTL